jgi:hypothetical protein
MRLSFFLPAALLIAGSATAQTTSPEQQLQQNQRLMTLQQECHQRDRQSCEEHGQLQTQIGQQRANLPSGSTTPRPDTWLMRLHEDCVWRGGPYPCETRDTIVGAPEFHEGVVGSQPSSTTDSGLAQQVIE